MQTLLIDLGNSRIKWSVLEDGNLSEMQGFMWDSDNTLDDWGQLIQCDDQNLKKICISSVVSQKRLSDIQSWCEQRWNNEIVLAKSKSKQLGLISGYHDPSQLGVDRWLAMLAVKQVCQQPFCVIDCGTAVTIDLVDADGLHLGGGILPGLTTMRKSLNQSTGNLPLVEHEGSKFALNTHDGIAGGTLAALRGAVSTYVDDARERVGNELRCWVSGGDASQVLDVLPKGSVWREDLVLQGLKSYQNDF